MKPLFLIGIVLAALGLLSLVVPVPNIDRNRISMGGVSMGVETKHSQTISPIISAVMILGGVGMMITSKNQK